MRKAKFSLSNKAVEDLSEIWNYTVDHWSENQADNYYALLIGYCRELAEHPQLGKQYPTVVAGLLGFHAGRHLIFYRSVALAEIEIVRILHDMMDLKSHL